MIRLGRSGERAPTKRTAKRSGKGAFQSLTNFYEKALLVKPTCRPYIVAERPRFSAFRAMPPLGEPLSLVARYIG